MDKETALQAWKRLRSEIDADNWLFVGTINPEMVDRAIEALEGKDTNVPSNSALDHIHNVVAENEYKRGYEQGKEDAAHEWIPVSEGLPEEETDVLVTRKFLGCEDGSHGWNNHISPTTYVEVASYFDSGWTALSDEYKIARSKHTDPIAWMPLPKPYKEGE